MPSQDWRWFKSQAIAESGLNPAAVSACGARGIMQLMPATAKELGAIATDPESSIQGGIKYDRDLWNGWKALTDPDEKRRFMFASYNAGPGSIRKAARLAVDRMRWSPVAAQLPKVTGKHASETTTYVRRIESTFSRLQ